MGSPQTSVLVGRDPVQASSKLGSSLLIYVDDLDRFSGSSISNCSPLVNSSMKGKHFLEGEKKLHNIVYKLVDNGVSSNTLVTIDEGFVSRPTWVNH